MVMMVPADHIKNLNTINQLDLVDVYGMLPLQYSCHENPMGGGAWWATVHGVAELDMTEHTHPHTFTGLLMLTFPRQS